MVDMKFWKFYDSRITLYSGVFGVARRKNGVVRINN